MNRDVVFRKLLCYGLFPERLECILSSKKFGEWAINNNSKINIENSKKYKLFPFKITRNNNSQRFLGVPHPLAYLRVCRQLHKDWSRINIMKRTVKNYNDISMIVPKLSNKNGRLISMLSYNQDKEKDQKLLDKQFGKKYLVYADISDFFPSIYTHVISWALVGKEKAKKEQSRQRRWFNKFDVVIRNMQDGETKGVPIGPDISGIISEIILSQIDKNLRKYTYMRFIDDYKCFCSSKEEADSFIRELSENLEYYRLKLNTKKTKIFELPQTLDDDWVRNLRQFVNFKEVDRFNKNKVIGLLELSSDLFKKNPDESSIRYAAKVLSGKKYIDYSAYRIVLRYFLNLCFLYPYVIDICDNFISIGIRSFPENEKAIKAVLKNAIEVFLNEHVNYRRSDVMTWSLFLAIKYGVKIKQFAKISKEILRSKDVISLLICFVYAKINKENIDAFIDLLNKVDLDEWWLYDYEIKRIQKQKLKSPELEKMRKAKVSFLSDEINTKL